MQWSAQSRGLPGRFYLLRDPEAEALMEAAMKDPSVMVRAGGPGVLVSSSLFGRRTVGIGFDTTVKS